MDLAIWLLPLVAILAILVGYLGHKITTVRTIGDAETRASRIVEDARRAAADASREVESKAREAEAKIKAAELEAKEVALRARAELEQDTRARQKEIQEIERRVVHQEEQLSRRIDQLDRREADFDKRDRQSAERERKMAETEGRLANALEEHRRKLESVAGLTAEEAKRQLMAQIEVDARREAQLLCMRLEEEARETAQLKAKEVLATTIQRLAPDYTVETAVSIVDLPSDDMKGRIIGREGRNIRALELHTGVDLIVDDTPEAVLISAYDPYRREIARLALQKLIADGRIHPARIEEVVEKVKKEMEQHLKEEGEKACFEVGVHGLHPELVKLVGRMKFRTSYGQNCLQHSKEVAWLCGMMAAEIKADVKLAKRMGLLHDIGKALTHEQEGSHPELSLQVLTKYNESPAVINAALCGHENVEPETIEAVLVEAADGISAARPGARRDVLESYIKRLAKLEEIALSYKGVEMCYAIQAGRELRIMTKSEQVSDLDAYQLAKDISKRIEAEMQYPGHIKVVVIRETRAVEVARVAMTRPVTVLCVGDVFGESGRRCVQALLPRLRKQHEVDVAVVNVENAAAGFGVTPLIARTFLEQGVDVMTSGNHIWDRKEIIEYIVKENLLLRPANYPSGTPGVGSATVKAGPHKVAVLNLMGRVFLPNLDCPFRKADEEVARLREETPLVVVDMHCEATSESQAMGWYLDGRVSAVVGTHRHVQTADERVLPRARPSSRTSA